MTETDPPICPYCQEPMSIHPAGFPKWFCTRGHLFGVTPEQVEYTAKINRMRQEASAERSAFYAGGRAMTTPTGEPRTGVIRQALELARSIAITGEPWSEQAGTVWLAALTALDAIEREAAAATEPRPDPALDRVLGDLRDEVGKARSKHAPINSPHEGWAVIREELDPELWEHVCGNTGRSPEARKEALQVAAMGVRYILDLIDPPRARLAGTASTPETEGEPR